MQTLTLDIKTVHLTDEQFEQLCQRNPELRIEQTANTKLVILSAIGGEDGRREADLIANLGIWNRRTGLGHVFSSSTIFRLPGGGKRSPDAAWVASDRWNSLTPEQRRQFPPIAPDFVIELRSSTDDLAPLQAKMQEYIDSGVRLGWLIDPQNQQVEIYRSEQSPEIRPLPTQLFGESVLPDFSLMVGRF